MYYFAFENEDDPTMVDLFSEKQLEELFRKTQIKCETIVISACFSGKLAQILLNAGNEKTTVVAIN